VEQTADPSAQPARSVESQMTTTDDIALAVVVRTTETDALSLNSCGSIAEP